MSRWERTERRQRSTNAEQKRKAQALETEKLIAPRELKMPEPFYSALIHYFDSSRVNKLQLSDIDNLKRDLINIALNLCDGNKQAACRILHIGHATIYLYKTKYDI